MLKFKVSYSYLQGPDHHSQDYMTPDAQLQRCNDSRVVEAASKEEAEAIASEAAKKLLANPVMEMFEVSIN